jgi:predicted translin family RNA/ssDNA-binding protein
MTRQQSQQSPLEQAKERALHLAEVVNRLSEEWTKPNHQPEVAKSILALPAHFKSVLSSTVEAEQYNELVSAKSALMEFDETVRGIISFDAVQDRLPNTRSHLFRIREYGLGLCQVMDKSLDEMLAVRPGL